MTSEDGSPIRDAYVLFSWIELHDFVQQGEMRTDRSGAYSITIYFNPISDYDPEKGHICDRKLDSVIVSVYANGYRSLITKQIISGEAAKRDYVLHVASSDR